MGDGEPEKGDQVSWKWGRGAPAGTVVETKQDGEIAIQTSRGNTVKRNASENNPAVRIERSGNEVVKRASELTIDKKADRSEGDEDDDEDNEDSAPHRITRSGKEVKKGKAK
ncbi:hypothetical protein VTK73DRAFT_1015 [Phialemonium thermophilum]|uniref:Hypervirulence associated protein TUDOR domain-containing protein n=1 Tax=Phialemonium thermophilum TaxID=223376 RepID=A0ABR3XCR4_9PEZI